MNGCTTDSVRNEERRGLYYLSLLLIAGAICLVCSPSYAADVSDDDLKLIKRDDRGNLLYIQKEAPSGNDDSAARIMLKFIMNGGKTIVYFNDEIDCDRNMVRRLDMRMHNPTSQGDGEPFYENAFRAEWDIPSGGIEKIAMGYVCGDTPVRDVREHISDEGK